MHLTGLSFKYCFLDSINIFSLRRGIERNKTLVKLDLSANALDSLMGIYIIKALKENISLVDINFSKNNFIDDFAIELANLLKVN